MLYPVAPFIELNGVIFSRGSPTQALQKQVQTYAGALKEVACADSLVGSKTLMLTEIEGDLVKAKANNDEFSTVAHAAGVSTASEAYSKLAMEKAKHATKHVKVRRIPRQLSFVFITLFALCFKPIIKPRLYADLLVHTQF